MKYAKPELSPGFPSQSGRLKYVVVSWGAEDIGWRKREGGSASIQAGRETLLESESTEKRAAPH